MIWQSKVTQNKPANFFMIASFLLGIFGVSGPTSCPLILALPALCGRVIANYHGEACQEKYRIGMHNARAMAGLPGENSRGIAARRWDAAETLACRGFWPAVALG
jgi:hypothetical protein